jgi:hypothetical protein
MAGQSKVIRHTKIMVRLGFLLGSLGLHSEAYAIDKLKLHGLLDVQAVAVTGRDNSWLDGGPLGLRYGEGDNLIQFAQGGFDLSYTLAPTLKADVTALAYTSDQAEVTISEALLHYRPIPNSQWRQEYRVGVFHLPGALENRGPLWSSPYSITPSVINTWLGEEARVLGAETRWSLPGKFRQADYDVSLYGAIFGGNDTLGMMLTWRGWAQHDRIAGIGSRYPVADLPQLRDGALFEQQARRYQPIVEVDNRPGYYFGGDLMLGKQFGRGRTLKLSYLYYDNQADPTVIKNGQYGWETKFHHLGAHWRLSNKTEVLAQALSGSTLMGKGLTSSVEADFWSAYTMLTHRLGAHRATLRWDRFEVEDLDETPEDSNHEHGHSWTLSYSLNWGKGFKTSLSRMHWESERQGRHYNPDKGHDIKTQQWQFSLRKYW